MSDGQQMMSSSIEQHIDPSTTAKDLQVKIGKNKQIASKAKKLKKEQTQNRRNGKLVETINTSAKKSGASTSAATTNQERNTGAVVITIRLLKMESARSFEDANHAGNDNNHSKLNGPPMDKTQIKCENKSATDDVALQQQNNRHIHENSNKQNQNNNFNVDNNNVSLNQSDANYRLREYFSTVLTNNLVNCDNGNNDDSGLNEQQQQQRRRQHSIKNEHVNHALRSEVSICDKVQLNCTSQLEQPTSNGMMVNSLTQAINTINLTDKLSNDVSASKTKLRSHPDCKNAVISSNLISKVSPYPHHFPIANIIRSDCLNAIVGERKSIFLFSYIYLSTYCMYDVRSSCVCSI